MRECWQQAAAQCVRSSTGSSLAPASARASLVGARSTGALRRAGERRREAPRPGFGSAPDEEGRDPDHLSAPVAPPQSAADLTKHRQRSRAEDAAVAAVTVVRCFSRPSAGFASFVIRRVPSPRPRRDCATSC
ncbi:hypothetical protein MTO96_004707 [Rhipicephalus appendiculatus]